MRYILTLLYLFIGVEGAFSCNKELIEKCSLQAFKSFQNLSSSVTNNASVACPIVQAYVYCINPALPGCSKNVHDDFARGLSSYRSAPFNCQIIVSKRDVAMEGTCNDVVNDCTKSMMRASKAVSLKYVNEPKDTQSVHKEMCGILQKYSDCVKPAIRECPSDKYKGLAKLIKGFNKHPYNCSIDSRDTCDQKKFQSICVKKWSSDIDKIYINHPPSWCPLMRRFGECSKRYLIGCETQIIDRMNAYMRKYENPPYSCWDRVVTSQKCDTKAIMGCSQQMVSDGKLLSQLNPKAFCPIVAKFSACIEPAIKGCNEADVANMQKSLERFNQDPFYCNRKENNRCDRQAVLACSQQMNSDSSKLQQLHPKAMCPIIQKFTRCIKPAMTGCSKAEINSMKQSLAPFNKDPFYCSVKQNKSIEKNAVCNTIKIQACSEEFVKSLSKLNMITRNKRICPHVQSFKDCVKPALTGCNNVTLQQMDKALAKFEKSPFNCGSTSVNISKPVTFTCDNKKIRTCSKEFINNISNSRLQSGNINMTLICALAEDYKDCVKPALRGCNNVTVQRIHAAFAKFEKSPFNCGSTSVNISKPVTFTCDHKKMRTCLKEFMNSISKSGLYSGNINMTLICTLAQDYKDCAKPALRGCNNLTIQKVQRAFAKFEKPPFNCGSTFVNISQPVTATCDNNKIRICKMEFLKNITKFKVSYPENIKSVCHHVQNVKDCVKPALKGCDSVEVQQVQRVFDRFKTAPFNCQTTSVQTSIMSFGPAEKQRIKICEQQIYRAISIGRTNDICPTIQKFYDCISPIVKEYRKDPVVQEIYKTFDKFKAEPHNCTIKGY